MLNKKGPNTDPCGTPINKSSQSLYAELILVLYLLPDKKDEINLIDFQLNPYAYILANNRSCCRPSNALDRSIKNARHFRSLSRCSLHFSNIAINEYCKL